MTVVCNVDTCGFYDRGFCRQKVIGIDRGRCNFLFTRNGEVNPDAIQPIADEYKEELIIMEEESDGSQIIQTDN